MQSTTPGRVAIKLPAAPAVRESPKTESPGGETPGMVAGAAGWSSLRVRYVEQSPIRVRGPHSGKDYRFSGSDPVRLVDARDAESLLRTRFFAKAGD